MSPRAPRLFLALAVLLTVPLALSSCSVKRWAVRSVANALTGGVDVYGTDEDPELVRDALPFGLKTMESLLTVVPDHEGLLLALCQGFTQYSYAFVQAEGDLLVNSDYSRATRLHGRALRLYLRAHDYGLRGLERRHRGISAELQTDPVKAVARLEKRDLPLLYWTAASWGSAISLGKDRPELLADLPAIRALMERGLALDEGYDGGAIHEALILLDALPEAMGGSETRARGHFARAVELSKDTKASPYVTLATTVSVLRQDRREFEALLARALEFDPDRDPARRLVTIVLQRKARDLIERESDFFIDDSAPSDTTQTQEK
jgi:hypothetical protein